jgi:hypothetical protein
MPATTADKRAILRKMHEAGCFVLPVIINVGVHVRLWRGFEIRYPAGRGLKMLF